MMFLSIGCEISHAQIAVSGTSERAVLEVRDASLMEALQALKSSFGFSISGALAADRRMSGRFEGPLRRVIARVLDGTNFVIRNEGDRMVLLLIPNQQRAGALAMPDATAVIAPLRAAPPATVVLPNPPGIRDPGFVR